VTYWRRILAINAAAAVAVIGISGGFRPGVAWSTLARNLGIGLLYANCIGTILAIAIPVVARRCGFRRSALVWPAIIVTLVAGTIVGTLIGTSILVAARVIPRRDFEEWVTGALSTSLFISLVIGIAVTVYETLRDDEAEARRLAAEAQLASLESRVQPHFLFNTLNSIAALVHDDPARAEKMTTDLAALMRSSLDQQSTPLVPLDDELRIVRTYLEIERVRFGDRLRYQIEADRAPAGARVPRLAVQTLVENSVKYAISPRREGGTVLVLVDTDNGRIRVSVQDDGPGFDASALPDGHGLALLRSRLNMIFGNRAVLEIDGRPGAARVTIEMPGERP